MQAVEVVRRYMETHNFGIYDGAIYKKIKSAEFTYVFTSSVKDFIYHILGNPEVANQICSYTTKIIELLSEKSSRIIHPITLDYNFVEVLPAGYCFNIEKKSFELRPKDLKGIYFLILNLSVF